MPTRKRTGTTKKTRAGSRAASGSRAKKAGTAARGGRAKARKSARGRTSRQPRSRTVAAAVPEAQAFEVVEIDIIAVEPPAGETGMSRMSEQSLEEELLEELEAETKPYASSQAGVSARPQWGAQASEEDEDSEAGLPL